MHSEKPGGHVPVLLHEAVQKLVTSRSGIYIDATFGRGGHSQAILECLEPDGRLVAIDQDDEAIAHGREMFAADERFSVHKHNFGQLKELMLQLNLKSIDGLLLDLGVSSPQLDHAERGFSFQKDGPLDMRMDRDSDTDAARWIAEVREQDLITALRDYGDERYAKRIARAIVDARSNKPITTTGELAEIVKRAHPRWEKHHHPATRSFQAIRIAVNGELDVLRDALKQARDVVRVGGRVAVISFHSLEDRIVKREIRGEPGGKRLPSGIPAPVSPSFWRALGKAVFPGEEELGRNPRARSSVLRVAERVAV